MKIKKIIFTTACILSFTLPVKAAEVSLDIETTIAMSLSSAEDFKIQKNATRYTKQLYKEVRAEIFPQLSADIDYKRNTKHPEGAQVFDYQASAGATINQLIWAFGRVSSAIGAAKTAINADMFNESLTKRNIIYNAKYAYYMAVFTQENYNIASESYTTLLKNKALLEERSMHGRVTKKDNIRMAADIAARKPIVNNTKSELLNAKNTLKTITEMDEAREIILTENFPTTYPQINYTDLKQLLLQNEPALKAANETIKLQENLLSQYKAQLLPSIYAFASYAYKANQDNSAIDISDMENHQTIGIKASIPIWEGGSLRAKIKQAEINKENSELVFRRLKKNLLLELKNAVSDYNQYLETLKSNEEAVKRAKESFALSQESFASGQMSVIDLNDEEFKLSSQKLGLQETLFKINITLAKIQQLTANTNDKDNNE